MKICNKTVLTHVDVTYVLFAQVRTTYLSYLRKCLLSNYKMCYEGEEDDASTVKIKKCADQMELHAVRLALESQLYRENMLRLVRKHTLISFI